MRRGAPITSSLSNFRPLLRFTFYVHASRITFFVLPFRPPLTLSPNDKTRSGPRPGRPAWRRGDRAEGPGATRFDGHDDHRHGGIARGPPRPSAAHSTGPNSTVPVSATQGIHRRSAPGTRRFHQSAGHHSAAGRALQAGRL